MAQHIYVKLSLCLIIAAVAEAGILKSRQISLPPGAIVMDVAVRQKINSTETKTIATMKIEIDGDDKKVTLFDAAVDMPPDKVIEIVKKPDIVPSVDSRSVFPSGKCPRGFVKRGTVCFPDDDY